MANEVESRKLNDLRVVDLRYELEKRDLDKTGIKAVLLERLHKALLDEGHDPESYVFEMMDVKRITGRGKDEEKVDEDDETQTAGKLNINNENVDGNFNKGSKIEICESISETKHENDISKKDVNECKIVGQENEDCNQGKMLGEQKDNGMRNKGCEMDDSLKETDNPSFANDMVTSSKKTEEPTTEKATKPTREVMDENILIRATIPLVKEKQGSEANGIADNEDSINLTIGEDDEKLLADEEDSSQEKEQKDEGHGSSSHKMTITQEKSPEKTNQEKMEGKSGAVGEKTLKEDKGKKISASSGNSRNLWVSGLATTTRATDLKQVFSKYGKVIGAKVVTNARTPGARCYGYVTMSNADDAHKAVQYLHHTELHGRLISVEKAKGDSTGPPKRSEPIKIMESPTKRPEDKKKETIVLKADVKKEENIVPPGTEGDVVKEPVAPGTEDIIDHKKETKDMSGHRNQEVVRSAEIIEKRPKSTASSLRSARGSSPVLTFDKIKEERDRQRIREKERLLREEERRRETERLRQREIDRKQREEFERLDREKKKLKMERERLLREKDELLRLKSERQRLERERQKLERERLEKEKEELERLKRQNLRLEEETRRKRSLSNSRDREYEGRKRPATDTRYIGHHSSQSRYPEQARSTDYKKEQTQHKSSRDLVPPPTRRPGFESEPSRRLIASVTTGSRESWPPKERDSGRFERGSISGGNFRDDSISSRNKPSESRHVRERYSDGSKGERYVERSSDSWHGGGSSGGRDTWVSGGSDRKQDHVPEPWSRNSSSRWPGSTAPIGLSSRNAPQSGVSSPIFPSNNIPGMPGMGMGMSNMGPFSGGDRFDAYKQPYFKGP